MNAPRVHHQWLPDRLNVEGKISAEAKKDLESRGHTLRQQTELGVVQAIVSTVAGNFGAADPRKIDRARTE